MILSAQNRDFITLVRWLGPWSNEKESPQGILRQESWHPIPNTDQSVKIWTYQDPHRAPTGAYLLGPGLHFKGAEHEGLDRFARILAKAGHLEMTPLIQDYKDMHIQHQTNVPILASFNAMISHA